MSGAAGGGRRGVVLGGLLALACLLAVVVLAGRPAAGEPFSVRSTAPDGWAALAELLRGRGARVGTSDAAAVVADPPPAGSVVVVPAPGLASEVERALLEGLARDGAVVVWGEPPSGEAVAGFVDWPARLLADTPADPQRPGRCDAAELDGLAAVDVSFSLPVPVPPGATSCFGDGRTAQFVVEEVGAGRMVTLGSPYLWANARLQPAKEEGGEPLDNAATALRLLGLPPDGATGGTSVTVLAAAPSPDAELGGPRDPIELLPVPVKLAVAQAFGAFLLYAWWRGRRLGPPVRERVPVEVAGSELVVAVGDLLRRKGSPGPAAADLRAEVRRSLAARLGLPLAAPVPTLATVVAARTGRDAASVAALLGDGPVADATSLVRLARELDSLRQEVLHGQPVG